MNDYKLQWQELNQQLSGIEVETGDLRAVFAALQKHQLASGFIKDDLDGIERFNFVHPESSDRTLRVQFNPSRASRFRGAGIQAPPENVEIENNGCFLCPGNIEWQQQGRQCGYELNLNDLPYIVWMNPFPLLPGHVVIATRDHLPQEWSLKNGGLITPDRIIDDLVGLASRLPGYAGIYNGVQAGASISAHMHYQFFKSPNEYLRFPLEVEAMSQRVAAPERTHWQMENYPLDAVHWYGQPREVIKKATQWFSMWTERQEVLPEMSGNFISRSESGGDSVSLYFVPRDRNRCQPSRFKGLIGGLEVMGELVFSSESERAMLDRGDLDYFSLAGVLSEVRTPINLL